MTNTEPKLLNRLKEETVPRDRYTLEGRAHDNRLCMEREYKHVQADADCRTMTHSFILDKCSTNSLVETARIPFI